MVKTNAQGSLTRRARIVSDRPPPGRHVTEHFTRALQNSRGSSASKSDNDLVLPRIFYNKIILLQ